MLPYKVDINIVNKKGMSILNSEVNYLYYNNAGHHIDIWLPLYKGGHIYKYSYKETSWVNIENRAQVEEISII